MDFEQEGDVDKIWPFNHDGGISDKDFKLLVIRILESIDSKLGTPAQGFKLSQLQNGGFMAITGVTAGGSGTFQETPAPAGSLGLQAGSVPTYSVDDPAVTLGPSPDGDVTKVVASVPATDTGASFNLTVSGTNTAGSAISSVFNIPILPAAATVSTGFTLNQL